MSDDKLILILIYILMVKLCCVFSYLFLQIMSCVVNKFFDFNDDISGDVNGQVVK